MRRPPPAIAPSLFPAPRLRARSRRRLCATLGVLVGAFACLLAPGALAEGGDSAGATPARADATVAPAAEGGGTTGAAPAVSATVEGCLTAETAAARSVTFTGQMETAPGASRMAMQIVVLEHTPGVPGFHTPPDGLGAWQRSEAGVKIYKYVRQVTDLPAPAAFRALIRYRWLDEAGHVMRSEEHRTPVCHQPGARDGAATNAGPGLSGEASTVRY